jgi:hypothetical protein
MTAAEQVELSTVLEYNGYVLTSYTELGLFLDAALADELCTATATAEFGPDAAELTKHIDKQAMRMVQDERALLLGTRLVAPVVDSVFHASPRARSNWRLYALNRYETGGSLGEHRDSVGSTVFVVTFSGVREFRVQGSTLVLEPGTVVILDGQHDLPHSVVCVKGPSVSAIFDVPDLLRG